MARIYLQPNSNWTQSDAKFGVYLYGNGEKFDLMTFNSTGSDGKPVYHYELPTDKTYPNVIFLRVDPSVNSVSGWGDVWNQTSDLEGYTPGQIYYVWDGAWSKGDGHWADFTDPTLPEETDPITVTLVAGTGVTLDTESVETTNGTVSTVLTLAENTSGYQWQIEVKNGETSYDNWEFDNSTKTLTIKNLTEDITLTISSLSEVLEDGVYIQVNGEPLTSENKATYLKVNDEGHNEYFMTREFQENDEIQVVDLKNGIESPQPVDGSGCMNGTDVVLTENTVKFTINCVADLYIEETGKIWVEAKKSSVSISYSIPAEVTLDPQPETWEWNVDFETNLTVAEGYIVDLVECKVGSQSRGGCYDASTGKITVTNIKDDISITITVRERVNPGYYIKFWQNDEEYELPIELTQDELSSLENGDEVSVVFDTQEIGLTVGDINFKIIKVDEYGDTTWYNPIFEGEFGLEAGVQSGRLMNGKTTPAETNVHFEYDSEYTKYKLYFKIMQPEGWYYDWGHYWLAQAYQVTYDTTNATITPSPEQTYIWSDFSVMVEFTGEDPSIKVFSADILLDTIEYSFVDNVLTIPEENLLGDIKIEAKSEIEGSEGWWLVNENGQPIAEMSVNEDNPDEYVIEHTLVAGQYYGFDYNGSFVELRDFNTAASKGPGDENEYYSGTGVGTDADVYLSKISLNLEKTCFKISRNCTVKIYIRATGRVWIAVEEEPVLVVGDNLDKLIFNNMKHLYLKGSAYHTYPDIDVEADISGKDGFLLKSLDVEHHGDVTSHISTDGIVNLLIDEVISTITLTPEVVLNEIYKKIKLFDKAGTEVLYPKTNTTQVVDGSGNTLQAIINDLLERIRTLENKINN